MDKDQAQDHDENCDPSPHPRAGTEREAGVVVKVELQRRQNLNDAAVLEFVEGPPLAELIDNERNHNDDGRRGRARAQAGGGGGVHARNGTGHGRRLDIVSRLEQARS